jgi:hypothetical protein
MAFPTIPTAGAGRILTGFQANTTAARTFPSLSSLTKNPGDLLLAIVVGYQSSLTSNIWTWPAGWTELRDIGVASQMCVGVAYRWSDGTETGTFNATQAGTVTGHAGMILMSIAGAHTTTPPEASAALANGTTAAANPAALDPAGWAAEDTLWISLGASGETALTGSYTGMGLAAGPPTNYADAISTGESGDVIGAIAAAVAFRQLNASSEDVGTWSSADLSNARNVALVIAVRPAPVDARSGSWTNVSHGHAATAAGQMGGAGSVAVSQGHTIDFTGEAGAATEDYSGSFAVDQGHGVVVTGTKGGAGVIAVSHAYDPTFVGTKAVGGTFFTSNGHAATLTAHSGRSSELALAPSHAVGMGGRMGAESAWTGADVAATVTVEGRMGAQGAMAVEGGHAVDVAGTGARAGAFAGTHGHSVSIIGAQGSVEEHDGSWTVEFGLADAFAGTAGRTGMVALEHGHALVSEGLGSRGGSWGIEHGLDTAMVGLLPPPPYVPRRIHRRGSRAVAGTVPTYASPRVWPKR